MNSNYQSFLEQNGSVFNGYKSGSPFHIYSFSSETGNGTTAIYEVDSYASICIADHLYSCDFEYSVPSEDSITIHQYDSIDSNHQYPLGSVYSGMQYIDHTPSKGICRYVIKKDLPARVLGIQLMPDYYTDYLKKTFGLKSVDFVTEIQKLPREFYIPEISYVLHQIKNFQGKGISGKLFYKSKIDEIVSIIFQNTEEIVRYGTIISDTDYQAILATIEYLNTDLSSEASLNQLAVKACMSPSKFKYVFKSVTKLTLSDYLFRKRMEHSCDLLLHSRLNIADIAQNVGYKNAGSFTVQFKRYMGTLPTEYRKKKCEF